jgi:hypothetical protein
MLQVETLLCAEGAYFFIEGKALLQTAVKERVSLKILNSQHTSDHLRVISMLVVHVNQQKLEGVEGARESRYMERSVSTFVCLRQGATPHIIFDFI